MVFVAQTTSLARITWLCLLVVLTTWQCNTAEAAGLLPLYTAKDVQTSQAPFLTPAHSMPPFELALRSLYHPTSELLGMIKRICSRYKERCQFEMLTGADRGERGTGNTYRPVKTPVVRIVPADKHGPPTKKSGLQKVFALFGEHARELISPESAVALMELILTGHAGEAAGKVEWTIFPVVNYRGHKRLWKDRRMCLRSTPNGIDLNRDYADHFERHARDEYVVLSLHVSRCHLLLHCSFRASSSATACFLASRLTSTPPATESHSVLQKLRSSAKRC